MSTEPIPHDPAAARLAELLHAAAERPPVCTKCNDTGEADSGLSFCSCFAGTVAAAEVAREMCAAEDAAREVAAWR